MPCGPVKLHERRSRNCEGLADVDCLKVATSRELVSGRSSSRSAMGSGRYLPRSELGSSSAIDSGFL